MLDTRFRSTYRFDIIIDDATFKSSYFLVSSLLLFTLAMVWNAVFATDTAKIRLRRAIASMTLCVVADLIHRLSVKTVHCVHVCMQVTSSTAR